MSYRKRVFFLIIGQPISSLGVAALVQANIGLDPWGALHQGLSNVTGLSFGICTILVGALAILISALLKEPSSASSPQASSWTFSRGWALSPRCRGSGAAWP